MNGAATCSRQREKAFQRQQFELLVFRGLFRRKPERVRAKGAGGKEWTVLTEDSRTLCERGGKWKSISLGAETYCVDKTLL